MFQKLLIPLDGSQLAEAVLPYATELASSHRSTVVLLQVVPLVSHLTGMELGGAADIPPVGPGGTDAIEEALAAEAARAEEYLQGMARALGKKGLAVEWEVRRGTPAQEVIQCAKERQVGLIALSTHGRSGLGRLIFGSVADQVIRQSGLPILLVKPDMKGEEETGPPGEG